MHDDMEAELRPSAPPSTPPTVKASRLSIDVRLTQKPGRCPDGALGFGKIFTDHVFEMEYVGAEKRWRNARIHPFEALSMTPAAAVLHYAQSIFEGLKVFRGKDGTLRIFRPDRHAARLSRSAERLCMPAFPEADFVESIERLAAIEKAWVPTAPGSALYVRPMMVATEGFLGVRPSSNYSYLVLLCPVDAYYAEGFAPVRIFVEEEQVRAAPGGLGEAKTGANYAASLQAAERAKKKGYAQVLWLDAKEHRYVEEVGTMNLFVAIGDEVITPPLDGTILPGVTRESALALLKARGVKAVERRVTVDEIRAAAKAGTLKEIFGTGTAAVISPVGVLGFRDGDLTIGDGQPGPIARSLLDEIQAIQRGDAPDRFGWVRTFS
jgi:branched-chain amino acid aminotransferase